MKAYRRIMTFLLTGIIALCLCACGKVQDASTAVPGNAPVTEASEDFVPTHPALTMPDDTREFAPTEIKGRRFAYELLDNDWVAFFRYAYCEGVPTPYAYSFAINNMRYRYNEEWSETWTENIDEKGNTIYNVGYTINPVKSWFSHNERRRNDRDKINELFETLCPEQLLALSENDLQFEELDKDLFFRLMRKALKDDQTTEKNLPTRELDYYFDMEFENTFKDDYKFQVCYVGDLKYIERIVIDVLYKTGEEYNDYDQLSDLVRDGKANSGQQEAYAMIRKIEDAVVAQNRFDALSDEYEDLEIGGIDFSRLWQFMYDLESRDILFGERANFYGFEKNRPLIRKDMTAEEFATREVPTGIEETP